MPSASVHTEACVLSQQPPADAFQTCTLFSIELGVVTALQRLPKRPGSRNVRLDLFDRADLDLESANQGRTWFVREVRLIERATAIGRSYEALRAASALAMLVARNPVEAEARPRTAQLLQAALAAFGRADPELVLFKSLFRFGRDEGYPLSQQWLPSLPSELRQAADRLLRTPLSGLGSEEDRRHAPLLRKRLEEYLKGYTDILL